MSKHVPSSPDQYIPSSVSFLADIILVALVTVSTVAFVLLTGRAGGPPVLRPVFGSLLVFVCPGYAITAALFPRRHGPVADEGRVPATVSGPERAVLAVGLSVVVVPSVGLALTLLSIPISSVSVLLALGIVTLGSALLAGWRRLSCPSEHRFRVPVRRYVPDVEPHLVSSLQLALTLTILFAVAGLGAAILTATPGEQYTEVAILDEEENGTLSADEYPLTLSANDTRTLALEIENQEREVTEYTVVVVRQAISETGDVENTVELDRTSVALGHGEQTQQEYVVSPPDTSDRFRVAYLVYDDDPPENPTIATAYRSVHLTVTVQE